MVAEYFNTVKPQGRGRPHIVINDKGKQFITMLAKYMVTDEEIAAELDVTVDTLHNKWNEAIFSECKEKGQNKGKVSLRRNQFKLSERSATMAIYLGKIYLGQRDMDVVAAAQINQDMLNYAEIFKNPVEQRTISDIEGGLE